MFDRERRIREWRQALAATGKITNEALDELEGHLRDEVQRLTTAGHPEEKAVELAVARLGRPGELAAEFAKVAPPRSRLWAPAWVVPAVAVVLGLILVGFFVARATDGRTELLLACHVVTVTLGYGTLYAVGALATCYVVARLFGEFDAGQMRRLVRVVRAMLGASVGLTAVGVLLGGVWAQQHLGRFWGWDPREVGGLLVLSWGMALLIMLAGRWLSDHLAVALGLVGNVVVSLAWFGAAFLDLGQLHSYGFPSAGWAWLSLFILSQAVFFGVGFLPAGCLRRRTAS